jgi:hypothetical protein
MANNRIQIKRTTVAGRTPNTTNSGNSQYIAAGELALNLADNKLYTSNGSVLIDLTGSGGGGSVNTAAQYTFTNTITFSNTITVANISANGSTGSNGNVLMSNGTNLFYSNTKLMTIYYANGVSAFNGADAIGVTGSAYVTVSQPGYVSAPYTGISRFYPPTNITINTISSSVSNTVFGTDLTYKLFKNGIDTGSTYTISVGQNLSTPVSASISLTTSDYLTLNLVSGTAYDLRVFLRYN